jgi:hypothetical protein
MPSPPSTSRAMKVPAHRKPKKPSPTLSRRRRPVPKRSSRIRPPGAPSNMFQSDTGKPTNAPNAPNVHFPHLN